MSYHRVNVLRAARCRRRAAAVACAAAPYKLEQSRYARARHQRIINHHARARATYCGVRCAWRDSRFVRAQAAHGRG